MIAILFAVAVIAVARWRGFAALLGLAFAGFIMVKFMFPALVVGTNPIAVGLIGSSAIMFVDAVRRARLLRPDHHRPAGHPVRAGDGGGLLGWAATRWGHLTGVSSEDDYVLSAAAPDLQLTSVVVCGIIVAGLGVLNDVTITQASAVWELADTDPDQRRLFSRAMRIGRDHIASTVYTIAFATAGAVLPVLLLIAIYDRPLLQVVQTEQFAGEADQDPGRLDRSRARGPADHRHRGRRRPGQWTGEAESRSVLGPIANAYVRSRRTGRRDRRCGHRR